MTRGSIIRLILAATVATVTAVACASNGSPRLGSSVEGPTVAVRDYEFEPDNLTVEAGGSVTWVWDGRALHNVTGEGFQSDDQDSGTFRHTFEQPGTYSYNCTIHPGMVGSVVVEAS